MTHSDTKRNIGCLHDQSGRIHSFEMKAVADHLMQRVAQARDAGLPIGLGGACDPGDIEIVLHASDHANMHLERTAHLSEGTVRRRSVPFRMDDPDVDMRFAAFVEEACDLLRGDKEIVEAGDDPLTPSATHVGLHPLMAHVLRGAGVSKRRLLGYRRNANDEVARNEHGIALKQVSVERDSGSLFLSHHMRHRRIHGTMHASCGTDVVSLAQTPEGLHLMIADAEMPDTVMAALGGRRLSDVVSHPHLDGAPDTLVVDAERWTDGTLALTMEPAIVTVAQAWSQRI